MTTDPIATRRYLAEAIKPRMVVVGHADGSVDVDPIMWNTMSALRAANARELERERTLQGRRT